MIGTVVHEQSESLWSSDDYGHWDPADAFSDGASDASDDDAASRARAASPPVPITPRDDKGSDDKENRPPHVSPDSVADLDRALDAFDAADAEVAAMGLGGSRGAASFREASDAMGLGGSRGAASLREASARRSDPYAMASRLARLPSDAMGLGGRHACANSFRESSAALLSPPASPRVRSEPASPDWARTRGGDLRDLIFSLDDHADPREVRGSCARCGDPVLRSQRRSRRGRTYTHECCPRLLAVAAETGRLHAEALAVEAEERARPAGALDVALKKLSFSRYTDDRPGHFPDAADWDVPVRDDWKLPASL